MPKKILFEFQLVLISIPNEFDPFTYHGQGNESTNVPLLCGFRSPCFPITHITN